MYSPVPHDIPTRAPSVVASAIVTPIIASIFISIRMYTRIYITKNLGRDDWVALCTLPFSIFYSVLLGIGTRYGIGLHIWDLPAELTPSYFKWIYISSVAYVISLLGYRLAILLLYLRLFEISTRFRYITWGILIFVVSYLTCNFITLLFGCTPISKYWNVEEPGHCISVIKSDYAYGALNVFSDGVIFILPLPMIWRLQLSLKDKIGVTIVFMSGALNWAMTIFRYVDMVSDLTAPDRTWLASKTFILSPIEINTGLVCGCAAVLKPFFRHLIVKKSVGDTMRHLVSRSRTTDAGDTAGIRVKKDMHQRSSFIELEEGIDGKGELW